MTVPPDVLAFADKKTVGAFDVTEPSGAVVARITVSRWSGTIFEATTATGEPLCSGGRAGVLSSTWTATAPDGHDLVSLRSSFWGGRTTATLPDGRTLRLDGKRFTRDWALREESGRDVLTAEPSTGTWSFHPDAWVVRNHDSTLSLAQLVGLVQLHRLMVKGSRAAVAAST